MRVSLYQIQAPAKRARKLGFDNVVDRLDKDARFALCMVEQGHNRDSL